MMPSILALISSSIAGDSNCPFRASRTDSLWLISTSAVCIFSTKGCFSGSSAVAPPNIASMPPKEDWLITSTSESKVGLKSTLAITGCKSRFSAPFISLLRKRSILASVKNCSIIRFLMAALKSSKRAGITPEPYSPGTFSNSIWMASQLVIAPEKANSPA